MTTEVATAGPVESKKRKASLPELEVDLSLPEPVSKKAKRALKKGKQIPAAPRPASDDDEFDNEDGGASLSTDRGLPEGHERRDDRDGNRQQRKTKKGDHGVWIGNLPFTLTRQDLFQWLVDNSGGAITAEDITRVNLPVSKNKDKVGSRKYHNTEDKPQNKGFAYVDFATPACAVAALALSETEVGGRSLLIKSSTSFEGRPVKDNPAGAPSTPAGPPPSAKVFVGNLPYTANEDDLWAHFEPCGAIEWVKVATFEDSGKCKGYAWIRFKEAAAAADAVRGFTYVEEEIETEADFGVRDDGGEEGDGDGDGDEVKEVKEKKRKTKRRKWWVNLFRGRELKRQFAEDDQVRYKKRFGKGGTANKKDEAAIEEVESGGGHDVPAEKAARKQPRGHEDVNVARLTGGIVPSQGKKVTF
jgi:RNA recognition motif-containing protein